jgi:hypothetical protein
MSNGPFKTAEEAETARKLGFKAPTSARKAAAITETHSNVIGYFNPNPWPVHIMISELGGLSLTLQQKGDYVLSVDGKKINDPILEQHVGPVGLAREVSTSPVPINYIPRVSAGAPGVPNHPVQEAHGFTRSPSGQMVPVMKPAAHTVSDSMPTLPQPGQIPVLGMTREVAEKLRLIKPTRQPVESTIVDSEGVPAHGNALPQIDYAEDMKPGEAKRAALNPTPPLNPEMTIPETPTQARVLQELETAKTVDLLGVTDVSKLAPKLPAETPPPVIQTPTVIQAGPAPTQGVQETAVAPPSFAPKSFSCFVDNKSFQYRSMLERHARTKYPDKFDEIMAPYPK